MLKYNDKNKRRDRRGRDRMVVEVRILLRWGVLDATLYDKSFSV